MILTGHVHNGVVVPDQAGELPEGAAVRIELLTMEKAEKSVSKRVGGAWNGQVQIADDFNDLPDDLSEAFGVKTP